MVCLYLKNKGLAVRFCLWPQTMKYKIISIIQKTSFLISYLFKNSFSENKFLQSIISDESVVVDIGSNVGSFINLILKTNEKAQVYSIEPNIELVRFQKNKFKNRKNIRFYNIAIDTKDGYRQLHLREPASHSSFYKTHQEEKFNKILDSIKVKTYSFNSFVSDEKINKISLLKIDVEGHDYEIFRSTKELLVANKIEYIKIEANQEYFEKIMKFAFESNFKFLGITKSFYYKNDLIFMDIYFQNRILIK